MTETRKPTCLPDRQGPTEKQTVKNGEAGKASTEQFAEGNPGGPGRPKGSHNRIGGELKGDILTAYQERGGIEWLRGLNERLFVQLLTKVMPREIAADIQTRVSKEAEIDYSKMSDDELRAVHHMLQLDIFTDVAAHYDTDTLKAAQETIDAELHKREAADKSGLKAAEKGAASMSETK